MITRFYTWYETLQEPKRFFVALAVCSPSLVITVVPLKYSPLCFAYVLFLLWTRVRFLTRPKKSVKLEVL